MSNQSAFMTSYQTNNSMAPQRSAVKLQLKPHERGFFSNMFELANKSKASHLTGVDAVNFLKTSGLAKEKLSEIWRFSARTSKEFLTREEFYCALRMISYVQNGIEITEDSLQYEIEVPLPRFDDVPHQATPQAQPEIQKPSLADRLPDFDQLDFGTGAPKQPQFQLMAPQQSFS